MLYKRVCLNEHLSTCQGGFILLYLCAMEKVSVCIQRVVCVLKNMHVCCSTDEAHREKHDYRGGNLSLSHDLIQF